jgi:hypothetical protein
MRRAAKPARPGAPTAGDRPRGPRRNRAVRRPAGQRRITAFADDLEHDPLGQRAQQSARLVQLPLRAVADRVVVVASADAGATHPRVSGRNGYDSQLAMLSLDQFAGVI